MRSSLGYFSLLGRIERAAVHAHAHGAVVLAGRIDEELAPCPARACSARDGKDGPGCSESCRHRRDLGRPGGSSPASRRRDWPGSACGFRPSAAASVFVSTATRMMSAPASTRCSIWATVVSTSAVFVAHMLCTAIGWPAPTVREPICTARVGLRGACASRGFPMRMIF